jgi:hypothetical protein
MPRRCLGREDVYLLLILDLGTRWGWVVSVTPRPRFTTGERTPVPIGQEAGWASEPVWTQRLEEKSFAFAGYQTLDVQSVDWHYSDWATPAPPCSSSREGIMVVFFSGSYFWSSTYCIWPNFSFSSWWGASRNKMSTEDNILLEYSASSLVDVDWGFRGMMNHPDDRGSTHLWNFGLLQRDYMAIYPEGSFTIAAIKTSNFIINPLCHCSTQPWMGLPQHHNYCTLLSF